MYKDKITFDELPQAINHLIDEVAELKKMVLKLQPPEPQKYQLIGIDDACRIIQKAKPTIYALVRKGLLPSYKKGKKLYFYEHELLSWIENGECNDKAQNHDQLLASMKSNIRRKPKSGFGV